MNGDYYLLEPTAFASNLVKVAHDGATMSKAGWIEITMDTPSENFLDLFIESFKSVTQYLGKLRAKNSKKRKNEDTSETTQK